MSGKESCVGYIQVGFSDEVSGEFICLAGIGCVTTDELEREWSNIPALAAQDESRFIADMLDASGDVMQDRRVSAETIEALTGRSVADLIVDGRRRLAAELEQLRGAGAAAHLPVSRPLANQG